MIWLVGCKGMLGMELASRLSGHGLGWKGSDREVDICDIDALRSYADSFDLDWVVNCAAYTAVDKAEDEPELAEAMNSEGASKVARIAQERGAHMVHISTDYVFDGKSSRPYEEQDSAVPLGVYGRTKAEGERRVRETCVQSYILRTSWLYGKHGTNFVHTMLRLMAERERIGVVNDQRGSPTWARDFADAIITVIESGKEQYGVYHFTDEGETSWYDFAVAIRDEALDAGILRKVCAVEPLTTAQYPTRARRPSNSILSKEKIRTCFGLSIPAWRDSLHAYLTQDYRS